MTAAEENKRNERIALLEHALKDYKNQVEKRDRVRAILLKAALLINGGDYVEGDFYTDGSAAVDMLVYAWKWVEEDEKYKRSLEECNRKMSKFLKKRDAK